MKLEREALMHYLDASFKKTLATAEWAVLGDETLCLTRQRIHAQQTIGLMLQRNNM